MINEKKCRHRYTDNICNNCGQARPNRNKTMNDRLAACGLITLRSIYCDPKDKLEIEDFVRALKKTKKLLKIFHKMS